LAAAAMYCCGLGRDFFVEVDGVCCFANHKNSSPFCGTRQPRQQKKTEVQEEMRIKLFEAASIETLEEDMNRFLRRLKASAVQSVDVKTDGEILVGVVVYSDYRGAYKDECSDNN